MAKTIWIALAVTVFAALPACNIFDQNSREPGADAQRLQERVNAFILPVSRITMTVPELYEVAKETRLFANIGVLETAQTMLYSPERSTSYAYPFEDRTPAQRTALLPHVRILDQATTLILLAHREGVRTRAAQYIPSPDDLHLVARRVVVTDQLDPCSVYPDFLIARMLHVLLKHRLTLQQTPGLLIESSETGYLPVWATPGDVEQEAAEQYNAAFTELVHMIDTEIRPFLSPFLAFGCDPGRTEIVDPERIEAYIDLILIPSFEAHLFDAGNTQSANLIANEDASP
jgi:hypothetical protein